MNADTRHDSSSPAHPLQRVGPRDPTHLEALHVLGRVESRLLHLAGIDDEYAIVYGHGRLGDVRAEDDFPDAVFRVFEHQALVLARQGRVQGYYEELAGFRGEHAVVVEEVLDRHYLGDSGQKHLWNVIYIEIEIFKLVGYTFLIRMNRIQIYHDSSHDSVESGK